MSDIWCRIAAARMKAEADPKFKATRTLDTTRINAVGVEIYADGMLLFDGVEINEMGGLPKADVVAALPVILGAMVPAGPWPPVEEAE